MWKMNSEDQIEYMQGAKPCAKPWRLKGIIFTGEII
jgi:hypothetical protein